MGLFSARNKTPFPWLHLESEADLLTWVEASTEIPVIFFKHSTRCSISSMALSRFENAWDPTSPVRCVYLDLLNFRNLSNKLAEISGVEHQSPQAIVFKDNEVVYDASHNGIDANEIKTSLGL